MTENFSAFWDAMNKERERLGLDALGFGAARDLWLRVLALAYAA